MKKVLIITYYWPPSGGAGVQRWLKLSRYLCEFNIAPIVVTVSAKKASYPLIDESLLSEVHPSVRVYSTDSFEPLDYYKKIFQKKQIPHSGFANEGSATFFKKISRFIRGNFFIPDARIGWNKFAFEKCCELIEKEKIDTIITTSPPHSTQLIGLKLKKKYSINWIADLRDPWTDIYYYDKLLHTRWAKKKDLNYELQVLENADKIIAVGNSTKQIFVKKSAALNANKIVVIPNGYDERDFKFESSSTSSLFRITYTGTISSDYIIDSFIEALVKLIKQYPNKIELLFCGSVSGEIEGKLKANLSSILKISAHIPHAESVKLLINSTILLLVIPSIKNDTGVLPGKLFEYLASTKPILCIGPKNGEAAQIINECAAGKTFDFNDSETIYNYLYDLYAQWINGGIQHNLSANYKKYSRKSQAEYISKTIHNE